MDLFKNIIYFERFRNSGVDILSRGKQFLKWNEIKEAAFYGTIGKIALFGEIAKIHFWFIDMGWLNDVQIWQLIVLNVFYSYANDVVCYFIGRYYYRREFNKKENEIFGRDEKISPIQHQTIKTLENIAEKLGAQSEFPKVK